MTSHATRVCDRCGGLLHDTEQRWGLCGRCLTNPDLPLPAAVAAPTPEAGNVQAPERRGATYRPRPLRRCGCGVVLRPRMRYCDRCRVQRRRGSGSNVCGNAGLRRDRCNALACK